MKTKKVLIIIPCYNEEKSIAVLIKACNELDIPGFQLTCLPINDFSRDQTLTQIKTNTNRYLDLTNNMGIGGAVQSGIKYALLHQYDYAVQMDGDGQHPPSELHKLLLVANEQQIDLCIGSRYLEPTGFQSSFLRRLGIRFLSKWIRLIAGVQVKDCTSGYRVFSAKAIQLFARYYPDKYPEPEVIVQAKAEGIQIKEVPVVMIDRVEGDSSISGFSTVYYMLKVALAIFFLRVHYLFKNN
ncbi:MAG: glycosyltransferase family 2 protein [Fluviicola sp.]|nr:glycosyltransferase family 2 protein [Fluviicola sp.]